MTQAAPEFTSRVSFTVDATMYDAAPRVPALSESLDDLLTSGLRDHFCGTNGAEYWMALCESDEYGHRHLVGLIDRWFPEAFDATHPAGATAADRVVRLVSLGPGSGDIDVRLLSHLEAAGAHVTYGCVDSSFELLRRAVSRIVSAPELHTRFSIQALCADFTRLEPNSSGETIDLLTLLGGTIGNYPEDRLIRQIKKWMAPDCHLLVDAWLWSANGWNGWAALTPDIERTLTAPLMFPARNRFVFGPMETVTTATCHDVAFEHEVNRSLTVVPGAVNIVTFCSALRARLRLTHESVDRSRIPLAATTRYDFDRLSQWFESMGLSVRWKKNAGPVGLFLLRRA